MSNYNDLQQKKYQLLEKLMLQTQNGILKWQQKDYNIGGVEHQETYAAKLPKGLLILVRIISPNVLNRFKNWKNYEYSLFMVDQTKEKDNFERINFDEMKKIEDSKDSDNGMKNLYRLITNQIALELPKTEELINEILQETAN